MRIPAVFAEMDADLRAKDVIHFPGYDKKLKHARLASGEKEAVVCGTAAIGGENCALFVMEPSFMMGSMGTVVGEKVTRLFEYAAEHSLPVVGYTVSGGARMQEGILSLMQMAKTSRCSKTPQRCGQFVYYRSDRPHHRRSHCQLCHGRGYHFGRTRCTHRICRSPGD